jgi:SAM-dependent methyltransferase
VRPETAERLLALNREFYQRFASAFVTKRRRLQPGVARALPRIGADDSVLDLGCGHGLLAAALKTAGHRDRYVGLDSSTELLAEAGRRAPGNASFLLADLADSTWPQVLVSHGESPFSWAFAVAVLHHLPGASLRRSVVEETRRWLQPQAGLIVSVWDFLASSRWRARIQPWSTVGLSEGETDPEDYLLDWREGGRGLRYVHRFSPETLAALAEEAGFSVEETYRSDGEGGQLGIYQVWKRT